MKKRFRYFLILVLTQGAAQLVRVERCFANPYGFNQAMNVIRQFVGYGGTGANGALTVDGIPNGPSNPVYTDSVRSYLPSAASAGATTVTLASATGFAVGNEVLIIQMLGSAPGAHETRTISSIASNTLTLSSALTRTFPGYSAGVSVTQVIVIPHYTSITINSGGFLTVNAFNGQTGGVMFFRASGNITLNSATPMSGTISVAGKGFIGGGAGASGTGPGGGAVGQGGSNTSPGHHDYAVMASGGGGNSGAGASGGGVIMIQSTGTMTMNGNILADGNAAGASTNGGGGAGGTVHLYSDIITFSTACGTLRASGGAGNGTGTIGQDGRIFVNYRTTLNCKNASPANRSSYRKYDVK